MPKEKETKIEESEDKKEDKEKVQEQEEKTVTKEEKTKNEGKKSTKNKLIIGIVIFIIIAAIIALAVFMATNTNKKEEKGNKIDTSKVEYNENTIKGNSLDNFDISFLKLEKGETNKIYSPLSIKYALSMLSEGTDGASYTQIKSIIGDYKYKKYTNSANLSLANALFVRNEYKDSINPNYVTALKNNYDAEVVYDSFATPDTLNNWISGKTLGLINKLYDDVNDYSFILTNALAIDMEWVNKLHIGYHVSYAHENFYAGVASLDSNYPRLKFNNTINAKATHVRAVANKYNIVKELGEENIRKEVGEAYQKWLDEDVCGNASNEPSVEEYLDNYIKEINANYNKISNSTDFYFHADDDVKVFGKDLKKYDGTTLEYVAIMPKKVSLKDYINKLDAEEAVRLVKSLKEIKLENFKDGVITDLDGGIPLFKYDYELDLMNDLEALGIKDIFDPKKANISKLTSEKGAYIGTANHKATIDFSNDGIKAAAVTAMGGMGAAGCYFSYDYDVPVEKIDLMFDKPYLYFIIDKNTGEVWFTGTVYNPTEISGYEGRYSLNEDNDR